MRPFHLPILCLLSLPTLCAPSVEFCGKPVSAEMTSTIVCYDYDLPVTSLEPLAKIDWPAVEDQPYPILIDLTDTQVDDLAAIAAIPRVSKLYLRRTPVRDLSPLAGQAELAILDIQATKVAELAPLGGLDALRHLNVADTEVRDLSALTGHKQLEWLDISGTGVGDLSPLAECAGLETLDLSQSKVTSLAPLHQLPALTRVTIEGTAISDDEVATFEAVCPGVELSGIDKRAR